LASWNSRKERSGKEPLSGSSRGDGWVTCLVRR
jgi:hypothetical protein